MHNKKSLLFHSDSAEGNASAQNVFLKNINPFRALEEAANDFHHQCVVSSYCHHVCLHLVKKKKNKQTTTPQCSPQYDLSPYCAKYCIEIRAMSCTANKIKHSQATGSKPVCYFFVSMGSGGKVSIPSILLKNQ